MGDARRAGRRAAGSDEADFMLMKLFSVNGIGDGLGPSLTDKFVVSYVVATDATGPRLLPPVKRGCGIVTHPAHGSLAALGITKAATR